MLSFKHPGTRALLFFTVLSAVLLSTLESFHFIDFREQASLDWRFRLRGEQAADPRIQLVQIDDASLQAVGEWPWRRSVYAELLQLLAEARPRGVFFDILFTEQSPDPSEDELLARGIRQVGHVVLPFYYTSLEPFQANFSVPILRKAADSTGYVNVDPESDGVTRRLRFQISGHQNVYVHPARLLADPEGRLVPPLDSRGRFWLNYPGTLLVYPHVSFQQVIGHSQGAEKEALLERFRDKFVIIGHTATGTTDLRPTPFSNADVGLSIQAAALDTFLKQNFLRETPWFVNLLLILLLGLPAAFCIYRCRLRTGLFVFVLSAVVYGAFNLVAFSRHHWILPLVLPLVCLLLSGVAALLIKFTDLRFAGEHLNRELRMAARIQESLLPAAPPAGGLAELAWSFHFAEQVGGDFFDWVQLTPDELGMAIADVSGKGIPAALFMAKATADFRRLSKAGRLPKDICAELNDHLVAGGTAGLFLTLIYAVMDCKKHTLRFAVAGHEAMIYYHAREKRALYIGKDGGPPLGLFEGTVYSDETLDLTPGDMLILYSDGVREQRNPQKEEFGPVRLLKTVEDAGNAGMKPAQMIERMNEALRTFQKDAPQHDDQTLFCVRLASE